MTDQLSRRQFNKASAIAGAATGITISPSFMDALPKRFFRAGSPVFDQFSW